MTDQTPAPQSQQELEQRIAGIQARLEENAAHFDAATASLQTMSAEVADINQGLGAAEKDVEAAGTEAGRVMDEAAEDLDARLKKVEDVGEE